MLLEAGSRPALSHVIRRLSEIIRMRTWRVLLEARRHSRYVRTRVRRVRRREDVEPGRRCGVEWVVLELVELELVVLELVLRI